MSGYGTAMVMLIAYFAARDEWRERASSKHRLIWTIGAFVLAGAGAVAAIMLWNYFI